MKLSLIFVLYNRKKYYATFLERSQASELYTQNKRYKNDNNTAECIIRTQFNIISKYYYHEYCTLLH